MEDGRLRRHTCGVGFKKELQLGPLFFRESLKFDATLLGYKRLEEYAIPVRPSRGDIIHDPARHLWQMEVIPGHEDIQLGRIVVSVSVSDILKSQTAQAYILYAPHFGKSTAKGSKGISPWRDALIFSFLDDHGHQSKSLLLLRK